MQKQTSLLIVDDDLGMLKTLQFILTEKGYDVTTCSSGDEAATLVQKQVFDIVLTDIKMPGMNGVELLQVVKRLSPQSAVMMITAYTMHELVSEARTRGASAIFSKPLDIDKLIPRIEAVQSRKQDASRPADLTAAELLHMLAQREQDLEDQARLIKALKAEIMEIKLNPEKTLDETIKRNQSENIQDVLNKKQLALFSILSSREISYDELLDEVQGFDLDIRDMAALRLQVSRLDKKLNKETLFKMQRIRRDRTLYLNIIRTDAI